MRWWKNRLSRRELETALRTAQRQAADLRRELRIYDQQLAEANQSVADRERALAKWAEWADRVEPDALAWHQHVCPTVPGAAVEVASVAYAIDAEVVTGVVDDGEPARIFDGLPKPGAADDWWFRSGMTTEIDVSGVRAAAAAADRPKRRRRALAASKESAVSAS